MAALGYNVRGLLDDHCRGLTRYRTKDSIQQWQDDALVQAQLKTSVETVLRLMYEEHFEVPFIAMHRKEVSPRQHKHVQQYTQYVLVSVQCTSTDMLQKLEIPLLNIITLT